MPGKNPTWTRTRIGRNRVHWVAYDDRPDSGNSQVLDQGYAASLLEADAAARAALAEVGMYQARRLSTSFKPPAKGHRDEAKRGQPDRPVRARPREFLYTRQLIDEDEGPLIAAHLVVKKTARRVYVTRKSCGPDQIGTEDEPWGPDDPAIALDRARLERDGSVYSKLLRQSEFYATRDAATGDLPSRTPAAFKVLGLRAPCTTEEIKAAYRRRAMEVHPDRGGTPADFQAVEAAYRRLLREAQAPEP